MARLEPLTLTAAFHLSPEELSEKAKAQARNDEGQFVEQPDVKATLPEPEEATPPPPEPTGAETIPAEDLLPGDVIDHEGGPHTVDTVELRGPVVRLSGRPVATPDEPSRPLGEWDADEYVALAPEAPAKPEWRVRYDEWRSLLPEDMSEFGKVPIPEGYVPPEFQKILDQMHAARDAYAAGDRSPEVMKELWGRVDGDLETMTPEEGMAAINAGVGNAEAIIQQTSEMMYGGETSTLDTGPGVGGYAAPGPLVQEHLAILLEMGHILNAELERRIMAVLPTPPESVEVAREDLQAERQRLHDYIEDYEEKKRAKWAEVLAAEWPRIYAENKRRKPFSSVGEVVSIANGWGRSTPARTALAVELFQKMEAAVEADPELGQHRERLDAFYAEIGRLEDRARGAGSAKGYGDPRGVLGTEAYAQAQREQAIQLISEIRGVGGTARLTVNVPEPLREQADLSVQTAFEALPTDWLADIDRQDIHLGMDERGHYTRASGDEPARVNFSPDTARSRGDLGYYGATSVHEFGHAAESMRWQIMAAEWAFSHYRSPRDVEQQVSILKTRKGHEMGFKDQWAKGYTGKVYVDSASMNWEILSTGLESLFAHSDYFLRKAEAGGFDAEFRAFILALLAAG